MRRTLILYLLPVLFVSLISVSSAQTLQPRSAAVPLYSIQPNDVLSIFTYNQPTLTLKVTVRPDGRISFPLIQDMQAANLNPGQLKERIEEGLKKFIDAPNVTVSVDAILSYKIYVLGKVAKPGPYMNEKQVNILQALSMAGGYVEFADLTNIMVFRGDGEDTKPYIFNLTDFLKGKNYSQNIQLRPGDVIVVQ